MTHYFEYDEDYFLQSQNKAYHNMVDVIFETCNYLWFHPSYGTKQAPSQNIKPLLQSGVHQWYGMDTFYFKIALDDKLKTYMKKFNSFEEFVKNVNETNFLGAFFGDVGFSKNDDFLISFLDHENMSDYDDNIKQQFKKIHFEQITHLESYQQIQKKLQQLSQSELSLLKTEIFKKFENSLAKFKYDIWFEKNINHLPFIYQVFSFEEHEYLKFEEFKTWCLKLYPNEQIKQLEQCENYFDMSDETMQQLKRLNYLAMYALFYK